MKWILLSLFFCAQCFSDSFEDFACFQGKLSKDYVSQKITRFLQCSKGIEDYYEIQGDALLLFASPKDKEKGLYEYRLLFGNEIPQSCFKIEKPLSLAKIAIDPGHFGGQFARLERRYVEMEDGEHTLFFDEGTLAFLTALCLKKRLEEQGANVFLTRNGVGEGAYPEGFFDWLKNHPEHWEKEHSLSTIFRSDYNCLDLRERAKRINEYAPDLTVVIHYNAIDADPPSPQKTPSTERNFNLVFIPGAFGQHELSTAEDRYHFLRLICSQDLEHSFQFAHTLIDFFTKHLQVLPLKSNCYNSLTSGGGVFCRNLCLTRLIKGPICYGESLIQNNVEEARMLSQKGASIDGIPCPERVVDVANAYFEAISYFYPIPVQLF